MRLIDADALMRVMYERAFETDGDTMWQSGCWVRYRAIEEVVKEQPTIEPEQQWIPCSERPPEEVGLYLVTLDYKEYGKCVTALWYHGKQVGWDLRVADVITAWMPLPEPYVERRQDGQNIIV